MELFRPKSESLDFLFLSTERYKFCVLAYDPDRKVIVTKSNGDISDRIGSAADVGQLVLVDPESRMIGLHLYRGLFKVIPVHSRTGQLQDAYNIRMEEVQVIDMKFLHGFAKPTLCVLYQDQRETRHVRTYEVGLREKEFMEGPWTLPNVEVGASMLIPLPKPLGGVIILGEQSIIYHNGTRTKSLAMKPTIIKSYGPVGNDYKRILLGDYTGRLWLLILETSEATTASSSSSQLPTGTDSQQNSLNVEDLKLELIAETSTATCIRYLDNSVAFIGSSSGDSQLIKINSKKDEQTGDYIELLENYTNLGPIVDMITVEMDRAAPTANTPANASQAPSGGQSQIVSCSGAFKDGSLRIIRNGIGINEHAQLDLSGIRGMWTISPSSTGNDGKMEIDSNTISPPSEKYLVTSYVSETRILFISGEELEEVQWNGFEHFQPTLLASNIEGTSLMIQITPKAVYLFDIDKKVKVTQWSSSSSINVCSYDANTIAVGYGSTIQLLKIASNSDNSWKLVEAQKTKMAHQIACLTITGLGSKSEALYVAAGLWNDISLHILKIGEAELTNVHNELLGGEILPRSLLFTNFEGNHHIFVGMGDGHVFSFVFDPAATLSASTVPSSPNSAHTLIPVLSYKKRISLGRQPVSLTTFESRGKTNVFACGDRPTAIYSRNKKVLFSSVNLQSVTCMAELNTASFPDSLAVATSDSLIIGTVDEIQKLHIRTIPMGEMVRRVCYQKQSRTYLISTSKFDNNELTGEETEQSHVRLMDDTSFEVLDTFKLDPFENAESITSVTFAGDNQTYYAVGTGYIIPTELDPTKGRILIFKVETTILSGNLSTSSSSASQPLQQQMVYSSKLVLVHETDIPGTAWCMSGFSNGKLVAGICSTVTVFSWNETRDGSRELKVECEHFNHVHVLTFAIKGDLIYVGDLMRGSMVLQYKPVDGRIEQLAADMRPHWMTGVAILDDQHYLASENDLNLLTVRLNTDATSTNDERERLQPVGCYHLGDQPNTFRHGSLVMQLPDADSLVLPSVLYGTVSGAIGVIASLPKELYEELHSLQNGINSVVKGIGGFDHAEWRSFANSRKTSPAQNFIDGDLIESVLDLSRKEQDMIAKAVGIPTDELIKKIEMLAQATH